MESFSATESEWEEIIGSLPMLSHPSIRSEVIERLITLVADVVTGESDNVLTLELDDACAVAVRRGRHLCEQLSGVSDEAAAAIAEAEAIIREHQQRA